MTYHIKFTTAYKKSYKRAKKRGLNLKLLDDVVDALRQGRKLDAKYRDHELHGNWAGFRECIHVTSAIATYVSVTKDGTKKPIDPELKKAHGF